MKKELIQKTIFSKIDYNNAIRAKEYLHLLQDDDFIESGWEEPHYSENNSWDGHFFVRVFRLILETDEEFNQRKKDIEEASEQYKKTRYKKYLELKKEFENE